MMATIKVEQHGKTVTLTGTLGNEEPTTQARTFETVDEATEAMLRTYNLGVQLAGQTPGSSIIEIHK